MASFLDGAGKGISNDFLHGTVIFYSYLWLDRNRIDLSFYHVTSIGKVKGKALE